MSLPPTKLACHPIHPHYTARALPMLARHPRKHATHASTISTPFLKLKIVMVFFLLFERSIAVYLLIHSIFEFFLQRKEISQSTKQTISGLLDFKTKFDSKDDRRRKTNDNKNM